MGDNWYVWKCTKEKANVHQLHLRRFEQELSKYKNAGLRQLTVKHTGIISSPTARIFFFIPRSLLESIIKYICYILIRSYYLIVYPLIITLLILSNSVNYICPLLTYQFNTAINQQLYKLRNRVDASTKDIKSNKCS